ncbi:MAG: hypothetical protein U9N87_11815, partial [Planctomycetota bacterium]|nr:hypothetical protein [Planctomycetota bacterium]
MQKVSLSLLIVFLANIGLAAQDRTAVQTSGPLRPVVEAEEDVYKFKSAANGAGPMWCYGSTCLVRVGEQVFASGLETLDGVKPLNNCRWMLFGRGADGWKLMQADEKGRTREPCPLAAFSDGRFFLSANPTLVPDRHSGPARPEIIEFSAGAEKGKPEKEPEKGSGTICAKHPSGRKRQIEPDPFSSPTSGRKRQIEPDPFSDDAKAP